MSVSSKAQLLWWLTLPSWWVPSDAMGCRSECWDYWQAKWTEERRAPYIHKKAILSSSIAFKTKQTHEIGGLISLLHKIKLKIQEVFSCCSVAATLQLQPYMPRPCELNVDRLDHIQITIVIMKALAQLQQADCGLKAILQCPIRRYSTITLSVNFHATTTKHNTTQHSTAPQKPLSNLNEFPLRL